MEQQNSPLPPDDAMLDRALAGDAAPFESQAVEHWLESQPDERRKVASIRAAVIDPFGPVPQYDFDARLASVVDYSVRAARRSRNGVSAAEGAPDRHSSIGTTPWYRRSAYQAGIFAATAAAVVGLAFGVRQVNRQPASTLPTKYATANGQRAVVQLPDGSSVTLNVASQVEVPADFAQGNRTIRMQGQALFTVAHHAGTPFTVISGRSVTRVLGTTFMVRHYATDTAVTIAVRDGKVAVGNAVLAAREQVTVDSLGMMRLAALDSSQFGFANNQLHLPWMPLASAIPELNRWYDAEIHVTDPKLLRRPIQAMTSGGTITNLSAMLELALNVRAVQNGRVLTLYPR